MTLTLSDEGESVNERAYFEQFSGEFTKTDFHRLSEWERGKGLHIEVTFNDGRQGYITIYRNNDGEWIKPDNVKEIHWDVW